VTIAEIDVVELADRLRAGAALVDVRELDEWHAGRVPGVPVVPLSELDARVGDLPPGRPLHLICRSGGRSLRAAEYLSSLGIECVNVAGGTLAWIDAGFDVEVTPDT
jgi:rhodanese-related sulfurtransferase